MLMEEKGTPPKVMNPIRVCKMELVTPTMETVMAEQAVTQRN